MANDKTVVGGNRNVGGLTGPIWMIGWLFTIGFAHLPLIKILLGIVLWPYYLGVTLRHGA